MGGWVGGWVGGRPTENVETDGITPLRARLGEQGKTRKLGNEAYVYWVGGSGRGEAGVSHELLV